jgi:hypothetical protein
MYFSMGSTGKNSRKKSLQHFTNLQKILRSGRPKSSELWPKKSTKPLRDFWLIKRPNDSTTLSNKSNQNLSQSMVLKPDCRMEELSLLEYGLRSYTLLSTSRPNKFSVLELS